MAGTAAEAGVSRQLVYDHFNDLDSLLEAFVKDRLARYRDSLPDVSALEPDEATATVFRHLVRVAPKDRRIVRMLVADVGLTALERARSASATPNSRDGLRALGRVHAPLAQPP